MSELVEEFIEFLDRYYRDDVGQLAQRYPKEQKSLWIDYRDLEIFNADIADDWQENDPGQMREYAEEALEKYDLPADVDLSGANIRLTNLRDGDTYYPGGFSPHKESGEYVGIEGQVAQRTEDYAVMVEAAFECQRCGTMTFVMQSGNQGSFQEPHECQGCERQGPFQVNFDQSEYVDGQKIRIEEPAEIAKGGDPSFIDAYVREDLVGCVESGDRVVVNGVIRLRQASKGNELKNKFEPYLDGQAVTVQETEFEDIEISDEEEERINELVDENDIFELARESIAPGITGEEYESIKLSLFLQLISGVRTDLSDGTTERGDFHILLIGDPGAGKSTLMDAVMEIAPRSVSVSGDGATKAGITAAAVRNDFGDNGEWTLDPGALVKAHKGVACVDELDKLPGEVANSMHEAMSQQKIPISKAGINATLPAQTAVLAAANPKHGRWNEMEPEHEQIELGSTLLSRFGLIFKVEDKPDETRDREIAKHSTGRKDAAKRRSRGDVAADGGDVADKTTPAVEAELLRKFVAYARREVPDPVFEDDSVRQKIEDAYVALRGINGYDPDAAVPVSPRKLDDIVRISEAAARAELSETIKDRHVNLAQRLVGASLRQFGQNEDGNYDVDIVESGTSKPQAERRQEIPKIIAKEQPNEGGISLQSISEEIAEEFGCQPQVIEEDINKLLRKGELYEPGDGEVRVWS